MPAAGVRQPFMIARKPAAGLQRLFYIGGGRKIKKYNILQGRKPEKKYLLAYIKTWFLKLTAGRLVLLGHTGRKL